MNDFPFRSLLKVLPLGAVLLDDRGEIVDVNRPFERTTGHRAMDVRGKSMFETLARGVVGLDKPFFEGLAGGNLDMVLELKMAPGGSAEAGTLRFRSFDDDGRTWVLGVLEATVGPEGRTVDVDALVDRVSTTKHALNNLVMGLMGHAEILSGMRDAPAAVRSRGEALLDQCRRLREEIQRLDVKGLKSRPND